MNLLRSKALIWTYCGSKLVSFTLFVLTCQPRFHISISLTNVPCLPNITLLESMCCFLALESDNCWFKLTLNFTEHRVRSKTISASHPMTFCRSSTSSSCYETSLPSKIQCDVGKNPNDSTLTVATRSSNKNGVDLWCTVHCEKRAPGSRR